MSSAAKTRNGHSGVRVLDTIPDPRLTEAMIDSAWVVLAAVLQSGSALEQARALGISATTFGDRTQAEFFTLVEEAHESGAGVDPVDLISRFSQRAPAVDATEWVMNLLDSPWVAGDFEFHARKLVQAAEVHQLRIEAWNTALRVREIDDPDEIRLALETAPERIPSVAARPADNVEAVQWPQPAAPEAFRGLAGEIVDTIAPHTEADCHAVLAQFLVGFGNAVGHSPHLPVGATSHTTNTNVVIVGPSSVGRKGTSFDEAVRPLRQAAYDWARAGITSGLSSGEGLIHAVRDESRKLEPVKDRGKLTGEVVEILADPGVSDKRLLVIESEFASVLRVASRDGSTLSTTIRQAWDSGDLRVLNKNSPVRATSAHISIIGHIGRDELLNTLTSTDAANGFANRFLFIAARRSKLLPDGGSLSAYDIQQLAEPLHERIQTARLRGCLQRDPDARRFWHEIYEDLSAERAGMYGAVTARGPAHVVRLSLIYALLDGSEHIQRAHIESALALWRYAEASAAWLFGTGATDPTLDRIVQALREAGDAGLDRTEIGRLFSGKLKRAALLAALGRLAEKGLARAETAQTAGRPREVWHAI